NRWVFQGASFFPATGESKAAAGEVVNGLVKGEELGAWTSMTLRDFAVVNCRWGLRIPPQEAVAEKVDAVVVGRRGDRMGRIKLPLLVMNKIGIEHVVKSSSKVGPAEKYDKLCLDVKTQLEVIQAEKGLLGKALSDLRSDIAAGKMDFLSENHRSKCYSGADRRGNDGKDVFWWWGRSEGPINFSLKKAVFSVVQKHRNNIRKSTPNIAQCNYVQIHCAFYTVL
ncbi:hypothetical protein PHJA_000090100, partial [Phtheirospermum japonicum]